MSSDPALRSALLGLTHARLDASAREAADGLLSGGAQRDEDRLLALAAARSLADRLGPRPRPAEKSSPADTAPPRESDARADRALADYLAATALLAGGAPETSFPAALRLTCPPAELPDFAEAALRRKSVPAAAYAVLGPRGRWVLAQHPRFRRRVAFLTEAVLPQGEARAEAYLRYHLAAGALGDAGSREHLLGKLPTFVPKASGQLVRLLLEADKLPALLRARDWLAAAQGKRGVFEHERAAWRAQLSGEAVELPEGPPRPSGKTPEADAFSSLAGRAVSARDEPSAERLLTEAALGPNRLLASHPLLRQLVAVLGAAAYGRLVDLVADRHPQGRRAPVYHLLLATGLHPVSVQTSAAWLAELRLGFARPADQLLARRYPHRLHAELIGELHAESAPVLVAARAAIQAAERLRSGHGATA